MPKGNGIIGGDPLGEAAVYAVVFWHSEASAIRHHTLAAFFVRFDWKNDRIGVLLIVFWKIKADYSSV